MGTVNYLVLLACIASVVAHDITNPKLSSSELLNLALVRGPCHWCDEERNTRFFGPRTRSLFTESCLFVVAGEARSGFCDMGISAWQEL